jgi:ABC-type lipoprotein release transport system permease subunit
VRPTGWTALLRVVFSRAVVGLGLAAIVTRFVRSLLFDVSPMDLSVFVARAAATIAVAALATWVPARRTSGVAPTVALRPLPSFAAAGSRLVP